MTIIAALPPAILWAASHAASTDFSKGPLCAIDIRRIDSKDRKDRKVRIVGVDGYRCFRCLLPSSTTYFAPEESLRLSPKAFAKAPTKKAVVAEVDDGGMVFFKDKFGCILSSASWLPDPWATSDTTFPNVEQIWPEDGALTCTPGAFVAMNASYLTDFSKVAAKISSGTVRLLTAASPIAPIVWQCQLGDEWLAEEPKDDVWLQYLLMPVQVRK